MRQTSSSMEPTVRAGEVITVDSRAYTSTGPTRWDVVAFEAPAGKSGIWISRVVGLPGETIDITPGGLLINSKVEPIPARLGIPAYRRPADTHASFSPASVTFPYTVPSGRYFVLGDNIANALDSRYWGGLEQSKIVGKVEGK